MKREAFSSTLIWNPDLGKWADDLPKKIDALPKCPLCGANMRPAKLATDYGAFQDPVSPNKKYVRRISEHTIWLCEFTCDETNLV